MKKYLLSILSIFVMTLAVNAQDFVINPNPAEAIGDDTTFIIKAESVKLLNNTNAVAELRWRRIIVDRPDGWVIRVCDKNLCYGGSVDECPNDPLDYVYMDPGTSGDMYVQASPFGIPGTATVNIEVFYASDPSTVLTTGVYTFEARSTTTSTTDFEKQAIRIYPNPTTDQIKLTENDLVKGLTVYNIVGRKVKSFVASPDASYDISDLPTGVYLVGLLDEDNQVLKTLRVSKK